MASRQQIGGGTGDFIFDPNTGTMAPNAPYTVIDGVTMAPAADPQDASGNAVTQLTSDNDARYAASVLLEGSTYWIRATGSDGVTRDFGPQVSADVIAQVADLAPQIPPLTTAAQQAATSSQQAATDAAAAKDAALQAQAAAQAAADGKTGIAYDTDGVPYLLI